MKTRFTKAMAVFLAVLMLFSVLIVPTSAAKDTMSFEEILASLTADSYEEYLAGAAKDGAKPGKEEIKIDLSAFTETDADGNAVTVDRIETVTVKNGKGEDVTCELLYCADSGTVTWHFNISEEQAGLYGIRFEYYPVEGSTSNIERRLYIDGSVPFDEARALSFTKVWKYAYSEQEDGSLGFKTDNGNNDIRGTIAQSPVLRTYDCSDIDGFYKQPFQFHFKAGERSISLVATKEKLAIKSITLVPIEEEKTLEEQLKEWKDQGYTFASADAKVTVVNGVAVTDAMDGSLRAETPLLVSDTAIYPASDRSSAINSPIDAFGQKLNVIGSSSYDTTGQWATYTFEVSESGIYNIVARFKQSALQGMFASRVIKLSGGEYGYADGTPKAPYSECYNTRFNYSDDWQAEMLNTAGEGTELSFYFEKGVEYTLCVEVGLGAMSEILNTIENSLTTINDCYLEILKLTGADPDEYRDYGFKKIMPQTIKQLGVQSKVLAEQAVLLEEICGTSGSNTASLQNISRLLDRMQDEDEIASNLSNLKSYIGTLGTWINTAKAQSITVDYYKIVPQGSKLPKANAGFFRSFWYEITSFIASFFVDYDAMGVTEDTGNGTKISVWIAYGRDQSQIWKNLITNEFSGKTGIAVDLKLVAAGTLLPSVLAKQGPDVYIGLGAETTINYAIRSAILDISDMPDFDKVMGYASYETNVPVYDEDGKLVDYTTKYYDEAKNELDPNSVSFNAAAMIPITLFDKIYGLPEQSSFAMLFYRRDILAELEIGVPDTWDDVLAAIPTLQANNMLVGLAHGSAINMFLYQFGGNLWKYTDEPEYADYAGAQIGLDTDVALDAFNFCCRLYTDYSFPFAYDGPNRFRTGEIPLLIADYVATYNQLTVFATEIRGLWEFTRIPGTVQADGTVNYNSIATVTATVMLNGCRDKDAAWQYMQWQASGEIQARYGNEMVALVGPAAKYPTANLQGIKGLSWSSSESSALIEQYNRIACIPNYPGSYIISRYTNFAFLAAYNDGLDPVTAMQSYISIINQEITRKRQEFELKTLEDGQTPAQAILEETNQ